MLHVCPDESAEQIWQGGAGFRHNSWLVMCGLRSCGAEITTGMDTTEGEGRDRPMQKAKMEIILTKSPQFDALMAATASQQQGGSSSSLDPRSSSGDASGAGPSSQPEVLLPSFASLASALPLFCYLSTSGKGVCVAGLYTGPVLLH